MGSDYHDKKLIEQLRKNHVKAFDQLFEKYAKSVYAFSLSLLKNREDGEEIVQEVFFRVWMNRHEIDAHKSFQSFLFTIAYNLIIDNFRKKISSEKFLQYLLERKEQNDLDTEKRFLFSELKSEIDDVVSHLPEKRKHIFQLSREQGLSHKKIAELLNISPKTVENQIALAIKEIKQHLNADT